MRAALFIMLDDCLIRTKSKRKYALHSEDWMFHLQAVEAIKLAALKKHHIIIISRQPAIANGLVEERVFLRKVNLIMETLERDLKIPTNSIVNLYDTDDESYMYIPKPGLIYEAAVEYELDLKNSTLVYGGEDSQKFADNVNMTSHNILNLNYHV